MRRCRIAIAGLGAVGRAIAQMLAQRYDRYRDRYDVDLRLNAIRRSRSVLVDRDGLDICLGAQLLAPCSAPRAIRPRQSLGSL